MGKLKLNKLHPRRHYCTEGTLKMWNVPCKDNAWVSSCCWKHEYLWVSKDYPTWIQQQSLLNPQIVKHDYRYEFRIRRWFKCIKSNANKYDFHGPKCVSYALVHYSFVQLSLPLAVPWFNVFPRYKIFFKISFNLREFLT